VRAAFPHAASLDIHLRTLRPLVEVPGGCFELVAIPPRSSLLVCSPLQGGWPESEIWSRIVAVARPC